MPWGSLPSIAALTRSGARKASEIVMLTFRALHPSRFAIVSALAALSLVSFIEPAASTGNRRNEFCACFGAHWANLLRGHPVR